MRLRRVDLWAIYLAWMKMGLRRVGINPSPKGTNQHKNVDRWVLLLSYTSCCPSGFRMQMPFVASQEVIFRRTSYLDLEPQHIK